MIMSKKIITCDEQTVTELRRRAASHALAGRDILRAKIILGVTEGESQASVARRLKLRANTVNKWVLRFRKEGLAGLVDQKRSGKPQTVGRDLRTKIIKTLDSAPPKGHASWDGISIAAHLGIKKSTVYNALEQEGIQLKRTRSWCVSTDKQFAAKSADIIGFFPLLG